MSKKYLISVIIPVYNGESYFRECVDSILSQSFEGFEVILIDDESPDNCGTICDEYAEKHDNVRVIHQKNRGINRTRKRGVEEARGEWVAFVDDDDTLCPNALALLYAQTEGTDMVIGFPDNPVHKKALNLQECRENSISAKLFPPTPWAKLYRRSMFDASFFDFPREIDGEEDMIMNIRYVFSLSRAPHFVFQRVYNFRRNMASVSHTKKASISHEFHYDKVRLASIPEVERNNYMTVILKSRLNGLFGVAAASPVDLRDKKHPYLVRIMDDVKDNHYHCSFREKLLLNVKNTFFIKFLGYTELVRRFIKYRLGLNN